MSSVNERVLPSSRARSWRSYALFIALVAPNLVLLGVFTYRPLIENIRMSFYDWNISSPGADFIGFSNYSE